MNRDTHEMLNRLQAVGISESDAFALRRISMTLHRWHELECGDDSGCIERDETTDKPYMRRQYWSYQANKWMDKRYPVADRERGALKRLSAIMARYPELASYVQSDPRGAALYILRPDDVPVGGFVEAYYSRGLAVYK